MNRTNVRGICLSCLVAVGFWSAGCSSSLVGSWENADPKADESGFVINNATFKDDGTYVATALNGTETVRLAGKYEFDGFNLVLKTPGKPERKYGATYMMMGPTLELRHDGAKQQLKKK
ncbi:MAG: hypothetical protein DCC65_04450 [Planctomycetota bacterium]|nr:MAG: hypothetical protein DCC65_04450 [Planctomycetota bacterium]